MRCRRGPFRARGRNRGKKKKMYRFCVRRRGGLSSGPIRKSKEDQMAQSLPQRALGKSGINCSAIGLGCMSFSGVYGPSEDAAAVALINQALDAGITMLDSSDAYGKGQNETLVGNAIKGRRAG